MNLKKDRIITLIGEAQYSSGQLFRYKEDDPRKTRFGEFLRRTNIDEIPQFINVLKGDMSIVGPRPHMLAHTEEFRERVGNYMLRHFVKPGITGWAQVNGWRGPTDEDYKIKKYLKLGCKVKGVGKGHIKNLGKTKTD